MILLAGATGLVGGSVRAACLSRGMACVAVGRRVLGADGVRWDFRGESPALPPATAAVCALGTTMRAAGSEAAFRAVDQDAVLAFATAAHGAGSRALVLVSSVGADARAGNFYLRVKGETEAAVSAIGFDRVAVLRPGLIIGPRAERRPVEAVAQAIVPLLGPLLRGGLSKYAAVPAEVVARAAVACALDDRRAGVLHNADMRAVAGERT